ncbi:MAG: hypothetical protein K2X82_20655 [Gemmataceae bacterium]|nr:hypothetical protein [Gemmataceae bacterium]
MATLERFLRTGELGPLRPGLGQDEVVAALGPPDDESVGRNPLVLKYGGLQLSLHQPNGGAGRRLVLIGLYIGTGQGPIPETVRPTDFAGTAETTEADVRAFLARFGLPAEAVAVDEDTSHLVLPTGVRIVFDGGTLHSIQYAPRAAAAARKQIAVSVPADTWDRLRELARAANQSVPELCAGWIAQRAGVNEHANGVGHAG